MKRRAEEEEGSAKRSRRSTQTGRDTQSMLHHGSQEKRTLKGREGSPPPGATEMSCKDPATNRLLASLVEVERGGQWLRSKGRWRTISFKRQAVERGRELRDPCWELLLGIKSMGGESILGEEGVQLEKRTKS